MFFKLAWRNLWRNKRRTLITISSIFFGVFIALFLRSIQLGTYDYMLNSFVKDFTGDIQLQNKDFIRTPSINNLFSYDQNLKNLLDSFPQIIAQAPRLTGSLMAIKENTSLMAFVVGILPEKEKKFTDYKNFIIKFIITDSIASRIIESKKAEKIIGFYKSRKEVKQQFVDNEIDTSLLPQILKLSKIDFGTIDKDENKILIGYQLAQIMNLKIGDSLILYGMGYNNSMVADKFEVVGFIKLPDFKLNKSVIYMNLNTAADLFSAFDFEGNILISSLLLKTTYPISILPNEYKKISNLALQLNKKLPKNIKALGWKQVNKELAQQIESDNISGQLMIGIVYFIIAFGIFGTILMMINEREKEFAILMAIGTRKRILIKTFILEMFIMTFIALTTSFIFTYPLILTLHYYPLKLGGEMAKAYEMFNFEPIVTTKIFGAYLINQPIIILLLTALVSLFPILKISKMRYTSVIKK